MSAEVRRAIARHLEDDKAVLYRVRAPHTVSRELLNLRGATVRMDYHVGDGLTTTMHLSVELHDGRRLQVRAETLAGFKDLDGVRDELEKRTIRLAH